MIPVRLAPGILLSIEFPNLSTEDFICRIPTAALHCLLSFVFPITNSLRGSQMGGEMLLFY